MSEINDRYFYCPECQDEGWCSPDIVYCGLCAGDHGDDVRILFKAPPSTIDGNMRDSNLPVQ